jgi:GAF domain-containing protein
MKMLNDQEVGASKVAKTILGRLDRRLIDPAGMLIRISGWLFLGLVVYMYFLEVFASHEKPYVLGWIGIYFGYLVLLELIRKTSSGLYDTSVFRTVRVLANIILMSSLISVASTGRFILALAYTVPIFAAIVYFSKFAIGKVAVVIISLMAFLLSGTIFSIDIKLNWDQFTLISLILTILSVLFNYTYDQVRLGPSRLTELAREYHKTLDLQILKEDILLEAITSTRAQHGLLIIINPHTGRYVDDSLKGFVLRNSRTIEELVKKCAVLKSGTPFECVDLQKIFGENSLYNTMFESRTRSVLAEPLFSRDGGILGVISVAHDNADRFDRLSKTDLHEFAFLVSSAIENCFLHREATLRDLQNRDISEKFAIAKSENDVVTLLINEVCLRIPFAEHCVLHRYDSLTEGLIPVSAVRSVDKEYVHLWSQPEESKRPTNLKLGHGLAGRALHLREVLRVKNVDHSPWYAPFPSEGKIKSLLVAPLYNPSNNESFGTISLQNDKESAFNVDDETVIAYIAGQCSLAIAKLRDIDGLREREGTLRKTLEEIRLFDLDASEEDLCKQIAITSTRLLGFKIGRVRIMDRDGLQLKTIATVGIPTHEANKLIGETMPYFAILPFINEKYKSANSYIVPHENIEWQNVAKQYFYIPDQPSNKKNSWLPYDTLLTPLYDSFGEVIGILTLDSPKSGMPPTKQQLESIGIFASAASWMIELNRYQRRLADQKHRAQAFIDTVSKELAKASDLNAIGEIIVQIGANLLSAEGCSLYVVRGNEIELINSNYLVNAEHLTHRKPISNLPRAGLTAWVASTGEVLRFDNQKHEEHIAWSGDKSHLVYLPSQKCESLLMAPVKDKDERVVGVVTLENKRTWSGLRNFDEEDEERLVDLATQFSKAWQSIERYKAIQENERLGVEDDMHDLINWYHSGVVLFIDAINEWLNRKNYKKVLELMPQLLRQAYATVFELKTLHTNLLTKAYEADTLHQAMEQTVAVWSLRVVSNYNPSMKIALNCPKDLDVPADVRSILVRIFSLAFSNAINHSGIIKDSKIEIAINVEQTDRTICLKIKDSGHGMNTKHIIKGFGLTRMDQLTDKLKALKSVEFALLNIESESNRGTEVCMEIKLKN